MRIRFHDIVWRRHAEERTARAAAHAATCSCDSHRAGDSVTDVEFVPPESPFYRLSEESRVARAQNAFGVAQLGATASAAEKARLDGELAELQRKASDTTAYGCDRVAALNEYAKLYYGL